MNYLLLLAAEEEATKFCSNFTPIWTIMGYIIFAIKVIVPILLVITGMVTFLKAVIKEGKEASESLDLLKKKALYAVVVFLVIQLVGLIMQFVSKESFFEKCAKCAFSPFNESNNCYIMKSGSFNGGITIDKPNNPSKVDNNPTAATKDFFDDLTLWSKKRYENASSVESVKRIKNESCYQKGLCNENGDDGMIRVTNGVFYFAYDKDLNGNTKYKGSSDEGLNKYFYQRIKEFASAAAKEGITIDVIRGQEDGFRSIEAQNYYCCCAKYDNCKTNDVPVPSTHPTSGAICKARGTCNGNGNTVASIPGTSPHGWGLAADLSIRENGKKTARAYRWAHNHAEEYGLAFRLDNEDWHVEPLYVCDINGTSGVYKNCTRQKNYYCPQDSSKGAVGRIDKNYCQYD